MEHRALENKGFPHSSKLLELLLGSWLLAPYAFLFLFSGSREFIFSLYFKATTHQPPHTEGFLHHQCRLLGQHVASWVSRLASWSAPQTTILTLSLATVGT